MKSARQACAVCLGTVRGPREQTRVREGAGETGAGR